MQKHACLPAHAYDCELAQAICLHAYDCELAHAMLLRLLCLDAFPPVYTDV